MAHLTFHELRAVSGKRTAYWFASSNVQNAGWSLSDWATALAGEVGEACNVIKKLNRLRIGIVGDKDKPPVQLKQDLAMELADSMIYLDLLAQAAGIELESAVMIKFNEDSERRGFSHRLTGVDMDNKDRMRAGLLKAAEWFTDYCDSHTKKGDLEKAARNRNRAEYCMEALNG